MNANNCVARDIRDSSWQHQSDNNWRKFPYGEMPPYDSLDDDTFATYKRSGATGLDYARNRTYAPYLGRFTSPDPYEASGGIGVPGSWNRYAYVEGDPVGSGDPTGLATQPAQPLPPPQFQASQRYGPGFTADPPYNVYTTICIGRFCRYVLINQSSGLGRIGTGEIGFGERRGQLLNAQAALNNGLGAVQAASGELSDDEFKTKVKALYDIYKSTIGSLGFSSLPGFDDLTKQGATTDLTALSKKMAECSGHAATVLGATGGGSSGVLPAFALVDEAMRTLDYVFGSLNRLGSLGTNLESYRDLVATSQQMLYGSGGPETAASASSSWVQLKEAVGRHERALFTACWNQ